MTRAMYKPLGLVTSVLGGLLAAAVFRRLWMAVAGEEVAPTATQREYSWRQVLFAAAAEGAVYGLVKAAVDRGGARGYEKLTGVWPGD